MITELFEKPCKDFKEHIELEDNDKILFSGRYGTGKTTFLNWFFTESDCADSYNVIHLFPVNYSVLSNEDIFTYIKYDILHELITSKRLDFDEDVIALAQALPVYLQTNFLHVFSTLLLLVPKLGKPLFQLYEELKARKTEFDKIKKRAESNADELGDFLSSFHLEEKGMYENNSITEIIQHALARFENKKSVLIIDDLDRIDPEHLFRIINVISAHVDQRYKEQKNKFGFDKIILVCDDSNVRRLFEAKYGQGVDFNGYFDKFYNREIFLFDNTERLGSMVDKLVRTVTFSSENDRLLSNLNTNQNDISSYLSIIFTELIRLRAVNLRTILKYYNSTIDLQIRRIKFQQIRSHYNQKFLVILVFDVLLKYFGSEDKLKEALSLLEKRGRPPKNDYNYNYLIKEVLVILDNDNHNFTKGQYTYLGLNNESEITYKVGYHGEISSIISINKKSKYYNLYVLWMQCFNKLKEMRYF